MKITFIALLIIASSLTSASDNYPETPTYPGYSNTPAKPSPTMLYNSNEQCRDAQQEDQAKLIDIQLKGISRLTNDIMQSTPHTLASKTYEMTVDGVDDYSLTLYPQEAFRIRKLSSNSFSVAVSNAHALYSREGGLYFSAQEKIKYSLTLMNQAPISQCSDSFQKCTINVSFLYNNQLIDFDKIRNAFTVDFEFDHSVVQLLGITGSKANFSRNTNGQSTAKLKLKSKTSGRVIVIESQPLAMCNQSTAELPPNPQTPDSNEEHQEDDARAYDDDQHHVIAPRIPINPGRPLRPDHSENDSDFQYDNSYNPDDYSYDHDNSRQVDARYSIQEIDQHWMRYKSTKIDLLGRENNLLGGGFFVKYRAVISNPYSSTVECDITIVSSRGINRNYQVIDTKVHKSVRIPARSSVEQFGQIASRSGYGTNGLLWATNYGHEVKASGCRYP